MDISWFMQVLNEGIAPEANIEFRGICKGELRHIVYSKMLTIRIMPNFGYYFEVP